MMRTWWKESVIYQIYPRSFNDSNGDGVGDIPGIIEKLDYIQNLGVDVIWLCPFYASPNDDNGYDISDYYRILEAFGTMEDFDRLLASVHSRGMKLIMDLVANHTSDEHAWFIESRSSVDNPKRDYYIWKDARDFAEPNNWESFFGGKAWQWDEQTEQYYLHLFTTKQPDLNWDNDKVRQEIYSLMKWWLDKGIDGYRMDVISLISKKGYEDSIYEEFSETVEKVFANGPKIHDYLQEMNKEVLQHYDIMTVGEGPGISLADGVKYVDSQRNELSMIFHFDHMFIDHGPNGKFDPVPYELVHFKQVFVQWDEAMKVGGWSSIFLGNHDFPRIVSRFGNDQAYHEQSAKALSMLILSLRGTSYIYQGDEIGMTNVAFDTIDDYRDVETVNAHKQAMQDGRDLLDFMDAVHWQGRDNARTPVQWDATSQGGFTTGEPWIKINPNYQSLNVASQENDEHSILQFYRQMIKVRKDHTTLVYGDFEVIDILNSKVFAYWRFNAKERYLVLINFSADRLPFKIDLQHNCKLETLIISNYSRHVTDYTLGLIHLEPWEATLIKYV
ncbi:MAG: oligo-1,6-glucosidase [Cyclobacteriaceae bacterium]|jgi:oligo-1,6-glucosidase